jgi:hypothetical protein
VPRPKRQATNRLTRGGPTTGSTSRQQEFAAAERAYRDGDLTALYVALSVLHRDGLPGWLFAALIECVDDRLRQQKVKTRNSATKLLNAWEDFARYLEVQDLRAQGHKSPYREATRRREKLTGIRVSPDAVRKSCERVSRWQQLPDGVFYRMGLLEGFVRGTVPRE